MILNNEKLIQDWGWDETAAGITPLQWLNSFENHIMALRQLSATPDTKNPFSYTVEMEKHRSYFANRPGFEPDFHIWYPVERELRNKILDNTVWKAAKALCDSTFIVPMVKLSDLAYNPAGASSANACRQPRDYHNDRQGPRDYRDDGCHGRNGYGYCNACDDNH
ncbi:hypothetical protein K438DRAFT_1978583 [Mycena galopus ATCC 62051]|nr:hypothetical protein K438DRAFT_1978583 [Mycena galopus ATCC 62051]